MKIKQVHRVGGSFKGISFLQITLEDGTILTVFKDRVKLWSREFGLKLQEVEIK